MTSVHGKPIVDARSMEAPSKHMNGRYYKLAWLVDQEKAKRQISFDDPNIASSANADRYANTKVFVTNATMLPVAKVSGTTYWMVNKRIYDMISPKSELSLRVPMFGDAAMFDTVDNMVGENQGAMPGYKEEHFTISKDDSFLQFLLLCAVIAAVVGLMQTRRSHRVRYY